ncbi:MAG: hypothetical protein ACE5GE_13710 [Phycisphaerae bacterium]
MQPQIPGEKPACGIEPAQESVTALAAERSRRSQGPAWVMAISLAVIATCLVLRLDEPLTDRALAQPVAQSGARGIFAFTGQLSKTTYGVFMVDVDTSTLWCYEVLPGKPLLKLLAARSWKYDRFLEDLNGDPEMSPEVIEELVEQQRRRKLQSMGGVP